MLTPAGECGLCMLTWLCAASTLLGTYPVMWAAEAIFWGANGLEDAVWGNDSR